MSKEKKAQKLQEKADKAAAKAEKAASKPTNARINKKASPTAIGEAQSPNGRQSA